MSEMMPYIWLGIIVFAFILKIHTFAFLPVWFIPSALITFVLSLLDIQVWLQVVIFFSATLILIVFSRLVLKKSRKRKSSSANLYSDSLIGKNAIVTEEINNYKNTGAIRLNGLNWNAQSDGDDIIYETGLVVIIVGIEGVNVICAR